MLIWLVLALIAALLEVFAVSRDIRRLELIAKPAVIVFLFFWLYTTTGFHGNALWFGLGLVFSLMGDVLLMNSGERFFLLGLSTFLFTQVSYTLGFRDAATNPSISSVIWIALIIINVSRLLRRITDSIRAKGEHQLVYPVVIYGTVISVMLYAAMSTIYDRRWETGAALFASLGAILFVSSDVILAWMRFVAPVKNGRVWNLVLYYLGQIGLIAAAVSQFQ